MTEEEINNAINKHLLELETNTNIEILKSIKRILNNSFGEQFNQVVKPTREIIREYIDAYLTNRILNIEDINIHQMCDLLKEHSYSLIVHFPEFEIKNSKGEHRTIKDLYVKAKFDGQGKFKRTITGLRTTLTEPEAREGYAHSHLCTIDIRNISFSKFCLGTGEIIQVLMLLSNEFDETNFILFCLHLKSYVRWESLEGNPHVYMNTVQIGTRGGNSINQYIHGYILRALTDHAFNFMKEHTKEEFMKYFKFSVSPKGVEVSATEELEEYLGQAVEKWSIGRIIARAPFSGCSWLQVKKDHLGNYYPIPPSEAPVRVWQQTPIFKFKGEDKYLTIEKGEEIKTKRYVNPNITNELCWRLTCELTKTALETH